MKKKGITIGIGVAVLLLLLISYFIVKNNVKEESEQEEEQAEEIVSIDQEEITSISFTIDESEYTFDKGEGGWTNKEDPDFPVNTDKMGEITDVLSAVSTTRTLKDVDNLEEYGLTDPLNRIIVETSDGNKKTLEFGSLNEVTSEYYMTVDKDESTVYLVEESVYTPFTGDLYDYASGNTYPSISSDSITEVQVEKTESPYMLKEEEEVTSGWVTGAIGNEELQTADSGTVSTLLASVSGLAYQDFVNYNCEDMSAYGLDHPNAVITITYEEETSGEDEDSRETKQVVLKVDSQDENKNYYVSLNDSQEIYTMTGTSLSEIINKKPVELYDLTVAYAAESQLSKIDVTEEGDMVFELKLKKEENEESEEETVEEYEYYYNDRQLDKDLSDTFYNALTSLTGEKILEEGYTPSEAAEFTVSYTFTDNSTLTVSFYPYDENYYAGISSSGKVYLVNKMSYKDVKEAFDNLIES